MSSCQLTDPAALRAEVNRLRALLQKIKARGRLMDLGLVNEIDACLDPEGYRSIFDNQQKAAEPK